MDGEVNNPTARITQDVKQDEQQETDAGDRHDRRRRNKQTQQTQTRQHEMDNTRWTTRDGHKEGERLSVGNELTSRRGLME